MADEEIKRDRESQEEEPVRVSRRQFLIGAGAGAVVGAAAGAGIASMRGGPAAPAEPQEIIKEVIKEVPVPAEEAPPEPVQPVVEIPELVSGKRLVVLHINGHKYEVAIEPQMTLAEVLRRDLGLTGTHIGCNGSFCSNCTVLVDGVAQNSCSLLAIREVGKEITTIEGLEQDGQLHPVQQAFWDQMGYQCGFCTSGQIMRAVELLNKIPNPTEAQIRRHMSGNMCKCSAYPNIIRAIQRASELMA